MGILGKEEGESSIVSLMTWCWNNDLWSYSLKQLSSIMEWKDKTRAALFETFLPLFYSLSICLLFFPFLFLFAFFLFSFLSPFRIVTEFVWPHGLKLANTNKCLLTMAIFSLRRLKEDKLCPRQTESSSTKGMFLWNNGRTMRERERKREAEKREKKKEKC